MIVENAPALLMFSFDAPLSKDEQDELDGFNDGSGLDKKQTARKDELEDKKLKHTVSEVLSWIPIPVDTKITPFASKSYNTTAAKTITMTSDCVTLDSTANTVTLHFTSPSGRFINSLIFALDFMFQLRTVAPTMRYFSDELIIVKGYIASYTHDVNVDQGQHNLTIEVQKQLWLQEGTQKQVTKIDAKKAAINALK